jgi:hypothetical protein
MNPASKAALVLLLLYGLSIATGVLFSMTGFVQSDSCWLVKLGILMLQSHAIPQTDPFSFTLAVAAKSGAAQPYVLYQWLSEIILAQCFQIFNLAGLLAVSAIVTAFASVALLFRLCFRKSGHLVLSALLVTLAAASVALRLMVRPETFSILFIVVWFYLWENFKNKNQASPNLLSLALLAGAIILWCNLHSGFVVGLLFLLVQLGAYLGAAVFGKAQVTPFIKNIGIALATTATSTLLNPVGIGLWTYLPRLFFSPMNAGISETQAMSLRELGLPIYYPFFGLVAFAVYIIFKASPSYSEPAASVKKFLRDDRIAAIVTSLIAICCAVLCKRLVSPMALILAYESACLMPAISELPNRLMLLQRKVSIFVLEIPVVAFALLAVSMSCGKVAPLTMPQVSVKFSPPFGATHYLIENWTGGNIFNNAQVGSMLDMYGKPEMKVFIDTRLDAFGETILTDYADMIDVRPRAKSLFDSYDIKWAVLTPQDRVSEVLKLAPGWSKVFEDQDGLVFKKTP